MWFVLAHASGLTTLGHEAVLHDVPIGLAHRMLGSRRQSQSPHLSRCHETWSIDPISAVLCSVRDHLNDLRITLVELGEAIEAPPVRRLGLPVLDVARSTAAQSRRSTVPVPMVICSIVEKPNKPSLSHRTTRSPTVMAREFGTRLFHE